MNSDRDPVGSLFLLLAGIFAALFFGAYAYWSRNLPISLGDDSIIAHAAPGRAVLNASPKEFLIGMISSFRGEDHLFPLYYLYGYLTESITKDSLFSLMVTTKFFFVLYVSMFTLFVQKVFFSRLTTTLFFVLFCFNLNLTWRAAITFSGGGFSPYFGVPVFYFIWRILNEEGKNSFNLPFLFLFSFLMTMGFETAFFHILFFSIFVIFFLCSSRLKIRLCLEKIFSIGCVLLASILPYLLIHWRIFGTFLPASRNNESFIALSSSFAKLNKFLVFTFFEPYYFLGRESIYLFLLFGPILFYLLGFGSRTGRTIYFAFLVSLAAIVLLGRTEHGVWIFHGTLILIVYSDCVSHLLSRIVNYVDENRLLPVENAQFLSGVAVFGFALVLADCSYKVDSFRKYAEGLFGVAARRQHTFYLASGNELNSFQLVTLGPDLAGDTSEVLWLGNQLFYGKSGLSKVKGKPFLSPLGLKAFTLNEPTTCEGLKQFSQSIAGIFKDSPIMVRTQFGYQRYGKNPGQIHRFIPILGEVGPYEICLRESSGKNLSVRIVLNQKLTPGSRTELISFAGTFVSISFDANGMGKLEIPFKGSSSLVIHPGGAKVEKIEIEQNDSFVNLTPLSKERKNSKVWLFKTTERACHVLVSNSTGSTLLVLSPGESLEYEHPSGKDQYLDIFEREINLPWGDARYHRRVKISAHPEGNHEYFPCEKLEGADPN